MGRPTDGGGREGRWERGRGDGRGGGRWERDLRWDRENQTPREMKAGDRGKVDGREEAEMGEREDRRAVPKFHLNMICFQPLDLLHYATAGMRLLTMSVRTVLT
eukprot:TRINITY_DN9479_c1_g2_i1.p1 TRINITY_DN9479_c1_g2~~TRINITY_DN9479_c1_g2_i1.p1  ORF type:complete len:104 (-),score=21.22 TRINITY_DN9479_c1_g2_i1:2-313(-)